MKVINLSLLTKKISEFFTFKHTTVNEMYACTYIMVMLTFSNLQNARHIINK